MFLMSGKLMARLGAQSGMVLVLLAHGARLLYYSLMASPWQILPVEILQVCRNNPGFNHLTHFTFRDSHLASFSPAWCQCPLTSPPRGRRPR